MPRSARQADERAATGFFRQHDCMRVPGLSEETLLWLDDLSQRGEPPPWRAMREGRDHTSGSSFIMIGSQEDRREDMYVTRDSGSASQPDLDLIAAARTYLPLLVAEVRRLRGA
jgi:hypothetical protein